MTSAVVIDSNVYARESISARPRDIMSLSCRSEFKFNSCVQYVLCDRELSCPTMNRQITSSAYLSNHVSYLITTTIMVIMIIMMVMTLMSRSTTRQHGAARSLSRTAVVSDQHLPLMKASAHSIKQTSEQLSLQISKEDCHLKPSTSSPVTYPDSYSHIASVVQIVYIE